MHSHSTSIPITLGSSPTQLLATLDEQITVSRDRFGSSNTMLGYLLFLKLSFALELFCSISQENIVVGLGPESNAPELRADSINGIPPIWRALSQSLGFLFDSMNQYAEVFNLAQHLYVGNHLPSCEYREPVSAYISPKVKDLEHYRSRTITCLDQVHQPSTLIYRYIYIFGPNDEFKLYREPQSIRRIIGGFSEDPTGMTHYILAAEFDARVRLAGEIAIRKTSKAVDTLIVNSYSGHFRPNGWSALDMVSYIRNLLKVGTQCNIIAVSFNDICAAGPVAKFLWDFKRKQSEPVK